MNSLETVSIAVTLGAILVPLVPAFRVGGLNDIGRQGSMWFEREEDRGVEERPSEDLPDAPLPRRPLRTKF